MKLEPSQTSPIKTKARFLIQVRRLKRYSHTNPVSFSSFPNNNRRTYPTIIKVSDLFSLTHAQNRNVAAKVKGHLTIIIIHVTLWLLLNCNLKHFRKEAKLQPH